MRIEDQDLAFLANCTDAELDPFIDILLDKDRQGRVSSELQQTTRYKFLYPQHSLYVDLIVHELLKFGGNSIANFFRGGKGVPYKELLCDVCDSMGVNYNSHAAVERIEDCLLAKVLEKAWDAMSEEERRKVLESIGCKPHAVGGITSSVMIALFRRGGFASYKFVLIMVNAIWRSIFGRGLSLVANKTICQVLAIGTGPIGLSLSAVWTAIDIASPAMRVIVPGAVYVATLRRMKTEEAALAMLQSA